MFSSETDGEGKRMRLHLEIGKLPSLRMIRIDSLLLHELPDEDRWKPLMAKMEDDGLLKHPPIAAKDHGAATHILLDGVNRVEALRRLGAQWLIVQETDLMAESLTLSTWHHVVEGLAEESMVESIGRMCHVSRVEGEFTDEGDFVPSFEGDAECLLVARGRTVYAVRAAPSPVERLAVISRVVEVVHNAKNRDRVSYTNMSDLARHYHDFSGLVCYKTFTKEEVLALSLEGLKFPSGVTRFGVTKRTLYFDMPLAFLKGGGTTESKQGELDKMIQARIQGKRIRFYMEPTFIFDD